VRKSLCDERISTKSTHNANAYEYIPSHPVHSCLGYDEISDTIQVRQRISQELIYCARIRKQIAEDLANLYTQYSSLVSDRVKSVQYYYYS